MSCGLPAERRTRQGGPREQHNVHLQMQIVILMTKMTAVFGTETEILTEVRVLLSDPQDLAVYILHLLPRLRRRFRGLLLAINLGDFLPGEIMERLKRHGQVGGG